MSNKNKNKAKKSGKSTLTLIQEILGVIGGIVGSIMVIYGFIKTFRDDVDGFTWLLFLGGAIWLIVLWNMFQRQKTYAYILLALTIVGGVAGWVGWQSQAQAMEDKVIVLIAKFDGPEDEYGLRDQIIEQLRETTKEYDDTEIIAANEMVTVAQGGGYARSLGKKNKADLVIWAWYKPTNDPNITIHVENLSHDIFDSMQEENVYKPDSVLSDLESFEVQKQIGSDLSSLVMFLTGYLRYQSGDYQFALDRFDEALQQNQKSYFIQDSDVLLFSGNCYLYLQQYDRALDAYNQVVRMKPDWAVPYNNRGAVYIYTGKNEAAIDDFTRSIQMTPNINSYINRGNTYTLLNQYEKAVHDLSEAISLAPDFAEPYKYRGMVYYHLGQYEKAIKDLDQAIRLKPDYGNAYYERGMVYEGLGKYEMAINDYTQNIQLESSYDDAYFKRGYLYRSLGQYENAIDDLGRYIKINPDFPDAYNVRGAVYTTLEQYDKAINDFNQAIQLQPDYPAAYNNRGTAYLYLNQYEKALSDYNQTIQLDPDTHAATYADRGNVYYKLGQYDKAVDDITQAITLQPDIAIYYYNRAMAYEKIEKMTEAKADFAKYKELTGQDAP